MMHRHAWIVAVLLTALAAPAIAAPRKAQKNDEQRENAAVKEARKEVGAAQDRQRTAAKAVRDAEQALNQAELQQRRAAAELQKAADRLETELADLHGLTQARRNLRDVQTRLDAISRPVLQEARQTAALREAQAAVDRERQRIDALRTTAGPADRAALARLTAALNRLEREALGRDTRTQLQQKAVDDAEESVRRQLAAVQKEAARSPVYQTAEQAFETSKRDVSRARQALEREQRDLREAAQAITRAEQNLARKTAADARDPNNRKGKR